MTEPPSAAALQRAIDRLNLSAGEDRAVSVSFDRDRLGYMECVAANGAGVLKAHVGFGHEVAGFIYKMGKNYRNLADYLEADGYGVFADDTLYAYIRVLRVAGTSRGVGVGGLLLEAACGAVAEARVRHVFLHATPTRPSDASRLRRFYERHGFAEYDVADGSPVFYRRLRLARSRAGEATGGP